MLTLAAMKAMICVLAQKNTQQIKAAALVNSSSSAYRYVFHRVLADKELEEATHSCSGKLLACKDIRGRTGSPIV